MVLFDIKACWPSARVLDIGRGRGFDDEPALREELSSCSRHYIGVEPDTTMASATASHEFHVSARGREILRESIDVAFTVFVMGAILATSPHCIHRLGFMAKKEFEIPWVACLRDPWAT
jgi:hypothetical protein